PFKTGSFAVRWRFKDVQIPREGQLPGSSLDSPQTPARGITPFIERDNHAVVWPYTLKALLKLGIDRETAQMSSCPLKLTVLQRVNDGDPWNAPQPFRFGAVYLDLAQYVGHGSVERWYLLRESKTNTTIKLTLEMEYVSGEMRYVPPPLGEPKYRSMMELAQQNPPGPRYARAQQELQEYLAKQMAEVIAGHDTESPKIEMLSRPGVGALEEVDDQHLKGSHFDDAYTQPSQPPLVVKLPEIATSSRAHVKSHDEPDDELSEESYFDPHEQSSPLLVVGEHGRAKSTESDRSRSSSNSSYASARSTMSVSESLNASYYRDDISLYSTASSRTAETDYGLYYRRMALSQSTIDSGRTAELRRSRSWTPSIVTITANSRRNSGSIGPPSLRL
ncbi:hypothetical protein CVT25_004874, partial [Psilocybe cyanescens]